MLVKTTWVVVSTSSCSSSITGWMTSSTVNFSGTAGAGALVTAASFSSISGRTWIPELLSSSGSDRACQSRSATTSGSSGRCKRRPLRFESGTEGLNDSGDAKSAAMRIPSSRTASAPEVSTRAPREAVREPPEASLFRPVRKPFSLATGPVERKTNSCPGRGSVIIFGSLSCNNARPEALDAGSGSV